VDELVPPMGGKAWLVRAGSRVRVVDVEGGQSGDVFAVAAADVADGLSNGRSFDYGGTIRLTTGSRLYSRRSRPLLTIVADPDGRLRILPPVSTAGQGVMFAAERDVLVAVASCSAASGGSGGARPLGVEISAGA
jgi:uncharacterized protein YcgI (DUF1989 family)